MAAFRLIYLLFPDEKAETDRYVIVDPGTSAASFLPMIPTGSCTASRIGQLTSVHRR